jgi:hypothetical protein
MVTHLQNQLQHYIVLSSDFAQILPIDHAKVFGPLQLWFRGDVTLRLREVSDSLWAEVTRAIITSEAEVVDSCYGNGDSIEEVTLL